MIGVGDASYRRFAYCGWSPKAEPFPAADALVEFVESAVEESVELLVFAALAICAIGKYTTCRYLCVELASIDESIAAVTGSFVAFGDLSQMQTSTASGNDFSSFMSHVSTISDPL